MILLIAQSFNQAIQPMGNAKGHPAVPELASYGLMFMLICLALIVVVRWLEARK